jgi:hypothetical protein
VSLTASTSQVAFGVLGAPSEPAAASEKRSRRTFTDPESRCRFRVVATSEELNIHYEALAMIGGERVGRDAPGIYSATVRHIRAQRALRRAESSRGTPGDDE